MGLTSLSRLVGTWALNRQIVHGDGRIDRLTGTSTFIRSGPKLIQSEDGWLETGGRHYHATRRYIWAERNGCLDVHFEDMRPFHTVPLRAMRPETVHLCDPDRYHVAYDFTRWPVWTSTWSVEGPRKSYRMMSEFRPVVEPAYLASDETAVHKTANS